MPNYVIIEETTHRKYYKVEDPLGVLSEGSLDAMRLVHSGAVECCLEEVPISPSLREATEKDLQVYGVK